MSNNILLIENFDVNQLPELQGMRENQLKVVEDNPFVEIIDNKTYEEAKKARTALVSARTGIEKQDTVIASKIKKFREAVSGASADLIAITKPHEDKQQQEVKRWEEIKEQEKQEKLRLEEERKGTIKNSIQTIIDTALEKINKLSFDTIDSLKVDFEQNLYNMDVAQFEEFELDFNEKLIQVKNAFSSKIKALEEAEAQRLESIRLKEEAEKLAAERAEIEAKRKAEEERIQKEREAFEAEKHRQEEELRKKNEEVEAEKNRLAKIEQDRIAKEEAERKEKEEAERVEKEKAAEKARQEAEAQRLEALKPEKEKIIDYLESIQGSSKPEIFDEKLKLEFLRSLERIQDSISDSIASIKKFK